MFSFLSFINGWDLSEIFQCFQDFLIFFENVYGEKCKAVSAFVLNSANRIKVPSKLVNIYACTSGEP